MTNITNFNLTFKQTFLTREALFSWDSINNENFKIYYDIFVNDEFLFRINKNKIFLNLGVGCENKRVKVRAVLENKTTNVIIFGNFSNTISYYTPADRYCNLKVNKLQSQKIKPEERALYIRKLNMLQKSNISTKRVYANAVKNQTSASSFSWFNIEDCLTI